MMCLMGRGLARLRIGTGGRGVAVGEVGGVGGGDGMRGGGGGVGMGMLMGGGGCRRGVGGGEVKALGVTGAWEFQGGSGE